jgi:hypothetical protein
MRSITFCDHGTMFRVIRPCDLYNETSRYPAAHMLPGAVTHLPDMACGPVARPGRSSPSDKSGGAARRPRSPHGILKSRCGHCGGLLCVCQCGCAHRDTDSPPSNPRPLAPPGRPRAAGGRGLQPPGRARGRANQRLGVNEGLTHSMAASPCNSPAQRRPGCTVTDSEAGSLARPAPVHDTRKGILRMLPEISMAPGRAQWNRCALPESRVVKVNVDLLAFKFEPLPTVTRAQFFGNLQCQAHRLSQAPSQPLPVGLPGWQPGRLGPSWCHPPAAHSVAGPRGRSAGPARRTHSVTCRRSAAAGLL